MNGTYLLLWRREVQHTVEGQYIEDVLIRERLVQLVFARHALFISMYPDVMALCVDRKINQGFESLNMFNTMVRGLRVGAMEQESLRPVLRLHLRARDSHGPEGVVLSIVLYREAPNLIATRNDTYRKLYTRVVDKPTRQSLWTLSGEGSAGLFVGDRELIERTILSTYEGVDQNLVRELTLERLQQMKNLVDGRVSMKPRLVALKPLKISLFAGRFEQEYDSFNHLLMDVIARHAGMRSRELAAAGKRRAVNALRRRIERLRKRVLTPEEVERYRRIGNCILANLPAIKRGDERVVLPVPSGQGTLEVVLDPSKSPQENAQAYFARYKRAKRGQPRLQETIKRLEQDLERIRRETWTPEEKPATPGGKAADQTSPFRIFHLESGAGVYVGKNARSNEELTFSFARPHDYFFHVRGYQGSHVILRSNIKRGQKAAKRDIEAAAAIAAYYSKAKTQKRVPVSYIQRKYLKKSKKGKPGTVILMREEVVFVDPELPPPSNHN